jgi:hypothetical protein
MNSEELIQSLNNDLALQLPGEISGAAIQEQLAAFINNLINTNFERLVSLLYRIDVSEAKLKSLLHNHPGSNAGDIIAALIIERQLQKIKFRQQSRRNNDIPEEEKW